MRRRFAALLSVASVVSCAEWPTVPLRPARDASELADVADVSDVPGDAALDAQDAAVDTPKDVPLDTGDGDAVGDVDDGADADGGDVTPDAAPCGAGEARCGGMCVDLQSSAAHCGACGNACSLPNAAPTCVAGACVTTRCSTGYGDCDGVTTNGCETDLRTTTGHCGACGAACNLANAVPACVTGSCRVTSCVLGYGDCDGAAGNGCEIDVRSAVAHCGRCGNACPTPPNATATCASGGCGFTCNAGYTNCGGACVDVRTNASHCGACGRACTMNLVCAAGACVQRSCAGSPTPPGCGFVTIAGGTFTMGSNINCSTSSTDPACVYYGSPSMPSVTVRGFALDAYEVTVARFNAYWSVRGSAMAMVRSSPIAYCGGSIAWQASPNAEPLRQDESSNWLPGPSSRDAHPMNGIDYWMAQEFCVWDGGRLPTDAEWEYAARGSVRAGLSAGRIYPWGDTAPSGTCDRAQWNRCPGEDGGSTRRVGSFPTGASGGIFDLAGNVYEWTADNSAAYSASGAPDPCANRSGTTCALCNNSVTVFRVIRGGSWGSIGAADLRGASRDDITPAYRSGPLGFRCARDTP